MKRRLACSGIAALALGVVCSCGSSSDSGSSGGSSTQLAIVIPPTTCSTSGFTESVAAVAVLIGDRSISNACSQATNACVSYKNMHAVSLIVSSFNAGGSTATAVTPGTYTIGTLPSSLTGTLAFAGVDTTDANCVSSSTSGTPTGTITISSVSSSQVTGSYNVTVGGTPYSGSINATVCPISDFTGDICTGAPTGTCTGTTQCL
jgi:hypothetical protein